MYKSVKQIAVATCPLQLTSIILVLLLLIVNCSFLRVSGTSEPEKEKYVECGRVTHQKKGYRITEAYETSENEFPSYVTVDAYKEIKDHDNIDKGSCGGVILSNRHILTAAHCVASAGNSSLKLFVRFERMGAEAVDRVCVSKNYQLSPKADTKGNQPPVKHDVAIIRLATTLSFRNMGIQPVCLPRGPLSPADQAFMPGQGYVMGSSTVANRLQALPVRRTSCSGAKHESIMCFKTSKSNRRASVCQGETGGPVFASNNNNRQTVYGLASFSEATCKPAAKEAWFADVWKLKSEILDLLGECVN